MNSDILFEISKFLTKKTGIPSLDQAYGSTEVLRQKCKNVALLLDKKLSTRPEKKVLEARNIIRKHSLDFDYIHTVLQTIEFNDNGRKISPRIANIAKRIDFELKRKMIMDKLGLSDRKR